MTEELKRCPFCGGEAEIIYGLYGDYVRCQECCASTMDYSGQPEYKKQRAIEAWNRRISDECI